MKLFTLSEAAPSDLMPDSPDPYGEQEAPAVEPAAEPTAEPAPAEQLPSADADIDVDSLMDTDDLGQDPEIDTDFGPMEQEILDPSEMEMSDWVEQESIDRRDRTFSHVEGFYLRVRPLDTNDTKWLAQLYVDGRMLDKGFITVPDGEDPTTYIQGVAEESLNLESGIASAEVELQGMESEEPSQTPGYGPPEMADAPYGLS